MFDDQPIDFLQEKIFLSAIVDTVDALIVVLDLRGSIMRFNRACEQATGYTFEQVKGKSFIDIFLLPEELPGVSVVFQALLEGRSPTRYENHWVTKDGRKRLIRWSNTVMRDEAGAVIAVVGTGVDITEQRQAEAALQNSEERYIALFNNNHTPMMLIDPKTAQIIEANPAACTFYGWERETLLRMKISEINQLPSQIIQQKMEVAHQSPDGHVFYFQHRLADGEVRAVEVHSGPVRVAGREYLFSIIHDITERRRIENEIKSVSRFPEENPNPVMRISSDAMLLYANASSEPILNEWHLEKSRIVPEPWQQWVKSVLALGKVQEVEFTCCDGEVYSCVLSPVAEDGYVNVYARNITAMKHAQMERERYLRELEHANSELKNFVFIASHDLQEPLRKLVVFGNLLKSNYAAEMGSHGKDVIDRMQTAARRMQEMLEDLLTYSRIDTTCAKITLVNLNRVVGEVVYDLKEELAQSGGSVDVDDLPTIHADPVQMRQLLSNLIGNALKFRNVDVPPLVRVTARKLPDLQVELAVADNGIGFEEIYLNRIFQPFQRLHGRSEYEGSGIGLAICRKIVEHHGGTITARSQTGVGSTFFVRLPLDRRKS